MKNKIICFEGGDGAGKGTLIRKLNKHFYDLGHTTMVTNEPGSIHLDACKKLREFALSKEHDFTDFQREKFLLADRLTHIQNLIVDRNLDTNIILQDRGILSNLAYGLAKGFSLEMLCKENSEILKNIDIKSNQSFEKRLNDIYSFYDATIYLNINPEIGLNRAKNAKKEFEAGDVIEEKGVSFQENVQKNYISLIKKFKNGKIVEVSSKNPEEVFSEVLEIISNL